MPRSQHSRFAHGRICSLLPPGWFAQVRGCALPSPALCAAGGALQPRRCSALQLALFVVARAVSSARKTCLEGVWHGKQGGGEAARGWMECPSQSLSLPWAPTALAGTAAPKDNGTNVSRCSLSYQIGTSISGAQPGLASVTTPAISSCLTGCVWGSCSPVSSNFFPCGSDQG